MQGVNLGDAGIPFVKNHGINPAVNFNFMLRVEGLFDLPCKTVRAFQRENEFEYIQEGGLNDYVHLRRKPISKPFTFQVERYVGTDIIDPLTLGTDLILPVILFVNRYLAYGDFLPTRMYTFTGCTVIAKEYGELNAEQSGLMLETTTIAYREMVLVDNIISGWVTDDTWKFEGLSKEGTGESNRNKRRTVTEPSKEDMAAKAKRWKFDTDKDGNIKNFQGVDGRTSELPQAKDEVRKADMPNHKWDPEKDSTRRAAKYAPAETKTENDASGGDADVMWQFDKPADGKPGDFRGTGGRTSKSKYAMAEVRKEAMEKSAELWNPADSKSRRAVTFVPENQQSENAEKDVMWTFDKPADGKQGDFRGIGGRTGNSKYAAAEVRKEDMPVVKWNPADDESQRAAKFAGIEDLPGDTYVKKDRKFDFATQTGGSAIKKDGQDEKAAREAAAEKWTFAKPTEGKGSDYKGVGGRATSNDYAKNEVRKDAMKKLANQWKFGDAGSSFVARNADEVRKADMPSKQFSFGDSEGSAVTQKAEAAQASQFEFGSEGNRFAALNKEEVRKADMPSRKWPEQRSAVDVAAFLSKK